MEKKPRSKDCQEGKIERENRQNANDRKRKKTGIKHKRLGRNETEKNR